MEVAAIRAGPPARQPRWGANRRARFPAARRVGVLRIASAPDLALSRQSATGPGQGSGREPQRTNLIELATRVNTGW